MRLNVALLTSEPTRRSRYKAKRPNCYMAKRRSGYMAKRRSPLQVAVHTSSTLISLLGESGPGKMMGERVGSYKR